MIPPELRIGSAIMAARLPTDCRSMLANPKSSSARQSYVPLEAKGDRYASGVGRASTPGTGAP